MRHLSRNYKATGWLFVANAAPRSRQSAKHFLARKTVVKYDIVDSLLARERRLSPALEDSVCRSTSNRVRVIRQGAYKIFIWGNIVR